MQKVIKGFFDLINKTSTNEQQVQEYLELNSELIPLPFLRGHQLHFKSIVSKFPIDTSLKSDFAYLTKNSAKWWFVLMELESPNKKIFTNDRKYLKFHSDFTTAISQMYTWRDFIADRSIELIKRIDPIRVPLNEKPVEFKYVLIYGRKKELNGDDKRQTRLEGLNKDDFYVLTYDSLISWYIEQELHRYKKNILLVKGSGLTFKLLHKPPEVLFTCVSHSNFFLKPVHKKLLKNVGYEIDKWEEGELLGRFGLDREFNLDQGEHINNVLSKWEKMKTTRLFRESLRI